MIAWDWGVTAAWTGVAIALGVGLVLILQGQKLARSAVATEEAAVQALSIARTQAVEERLLEVASILAEISATFDMLRDTMLTELPHVRYRTAFELLRVAVVRVPDLPAVKRLIEMDDARGSAAMDRSFIQAAISEVEVRLAQLQPSSSDRQG